MPVRQPESPTVTAPVLNHSPGDVGRRHDVHSLSFILPWCSIHLTHRPPVPPVAPEVSQNSYGMLARWYMLLGQFEYRSESQHANADGLSRQCGQCLRPDCLVGPPDLAVVKTSSTAAMTDKPFAESAMGDSVDTDLLPEMSGETWVADSTWTRQPVT